MKTRLDTSKKAPGRFDPFRVLSLEDRVQHLESYRSYLEDRNGEIDLTERRLSRREQYLREVEVNLVVSKNRLDQDRFFEHLQGAGESPIDEATSWLVAQEVLGVHSPARWQPESPLLHDSRQ